jgi:gluconokinase
MAMSLFIGVDIGTTNVKVIAVDETSAIVCEEKASYPLYQPQDGWCEQDAEEIFTAFVSVFKKVIATVDSKEIKAVSFSAAFHSIFAIDKNGKPLTPVITWADTRSNAYAKQLKQSGQWKVIYEKTGTPVHPMSPLCKIAWIRDNMPAVFSDAYKFISVKEYIWFKLFGKFQVDHSVASASCLFDGKNLKWCKESLAFCGINESLLSTPVPVLHTEWVLAKKYSEEFNLPADTLFVAGAGDGATANLGCGAILPGIAALTIGTSGAIRIVTEQSLRHENGNLFSYVLADNLFVNGGPINNGGIALQWFLQTFLQKQVTSEEDYDWFFKEAAEIKEGADGLIFLPYILGERAPVWDADARGVFIGIRSNHTIKHFMRAVIEGVCFALLQVLKVIEEKSTINVLYATGGFTQSQLWLQMLADILNKEIRVINNADASATGAVYMGMKAAGFIKDWEDIPKFSLPEKKILPDAGKQKAYPKYFSIFSHLYEKLKDDFELLSEKS